MSDERFLIGLAVDVSASMTQSIRNDWELGSGRFDSVRDALHVVTDRVVSLTRLDTEIDQSEVEIFAYAFGLRNLPGEVCDLFSLLTVASALSTSAAEPNVIEGDPYMWLRDVAERYDRGGWGTWIADHLQLVEAENLAANLRSFPILGSELGRLLPDFSATEIQHAVTVKNIARKTGWERLKDIFAFGRSLKRGQVSPKRVASEIVRAGGMEGIERQVGQAQKLVRSLASDVFTTSQLFDRLAGLIRQALWRKLKEAGDTTLSPAEVAALIRRPTTGDELASRFIYGGTPMRNALTKVQRRFRTELGRSSFDSSTLLIVSDGQPTDGDPIPLAGAIQRMGVNIISCFVTDRDLQEPRVLPAKQARRWTKGARLMYQLSSTVVPDSRFGRNLTKWGWSVPPGARAFAQINHSAILTEFLRAALG